MIALSYGRRKGQEYCNREAATSPTSIDLLRPEAGIEGEGHSAREKERNSESFHVFGGDTEIRDLTDDGINIEG